jgi:6,7-dimethyl-8-ribityllumazine synthase
MAEAQPRTPPRTDGARVLLVAARYYPEIVDALIDGAREALARAGAHGQVIEVAGALEIPGAIGAVDRATPFDGYVALGCVIRGETSHYDTVCNESARAIMDLTMKGLAIGNGILTVENEAQAVARAEPGRNKGWEAAVAALGVIELKRRLATGAL